MVFQLVWIKKLVYQVGASVVNALSTWLEVTIYRDGHIYYQKFENGGHSVEPLKIIGECDANRTGSTVRFKADSEIFRETTVYNYATLAKRLQEIAFLNKGLRIILMDDREDNKKDDNSKDNSKNDVTKLTLTSEKYKINDKYIYRVQKETKYSDYIKNIKTNGKVTIFKEDGTVLKAEEYVGTGMKMTVELQNEKKEIKIAVAGDLDGNGKVTATDLSTLNKAILKTVTLEGEYKLAGDLDESGRITATDLSTINQMVLKII